MQMPLNKEAWKQIPVTDSLFTPRASGWNQIFCNRQGRFGTTWGKARIGPELPAV